MQLNAAQVCDAALRAELQHEAIRAAKRCQRSDRIHASEQQESRLCILSHIKIVTLLTATAAAN